MTIKRYDEDAYLTNCEAKVLSCEAIDCQHFLIVLDQTVFFPEEGGQTPDKGTINGLEVTDVQIKDDVIIHTLKAGGESLPFHEGDTVSCELNWNHRFSNMQQHTGEHIISGIVYKRFGYDNVGFHLSDSIVTMDYNGPISAEELLEIEEEVNHYIFEGKTITTGYPSKEELDALNYRSKKELSGPIRIVEIKDVDICACCAPHVKTTTEVGLLKILDATSYKGGIRISILCGMRALYHYRDCLNRCIGISQLTSRPQEEIVSAVEQQKDTIGGLQQQIFSLQKELLKKETDLINPKDENVLLFTENTDTNIIRYQINELMLSHPGYCAIFNKSESGYNFIVGSKEKDCNELAALLRKKYDAKCGGKSNMIQGSLSATVEEIKSLFV